MASKIKNVNPKEVETFLGNPEYQMIDVREPFEYAEGHVPTAINIPLATLKDNLSNIDKSKKIVLICRSGVRSLDAAGQLADLDYDVYNMLGGFLDWTFDFEK